MTERDCHMRLRQLVRMESDARLAALRRASRTCASLEEELAALSLGRAAARSGAELLAAARHAAWIEQRRVALNSRLAAARAERDICARAARRAFGRAQALDASLKKRGMLPR